MKHDSENMLLSEAQITWKKERKCNYKLIKILKVALNKSTSGTGCSLATKNIESELCNVAVQS